MSLPQILFLAKLACFAACFSCAPAYYPQFIERNPDWDPLDFPRIGAPMDEVIASMYRPRQNADVAVKNLSVIRIDGSQWEEIDFGPVIRGEAPVPTSGEYIIGATLECRSVLGYEARKGVLYLVKEDGLQGFVHRHFGVMCHPWTETRDPEDGRWDPGRVRDFESHAPDDPALDVSLRTRVARF